MSELPPGPYVQLVFEGDGYGFAHVVDANCRPLAETFVQNETPGAADALAELLIRAEREHDPTPLDVEWLVSVGGEKEYPGDDLREIVHIPADGVEWVRVVFPKTLDRKPLFGVRVAFGQVWSIPVPTRGTFRTAMRLLGIKIEEKAQ